MSLRAHAVQRIRVLYRRVLARQRARDDAAVNVGDLGIVGANCNQTGRDWSTGDFNGDGVVNVGDLGILGPNYNQDVLPPGGSGILGAAGSGGEPSDPQTEAETEPPNSSQREGIAARRRPAGAAPLMSAASGPVDVLKAPAATHGRSHGPTATIISSDSADDAAPIDGGLPDLLAALQPSLNVRP